MPTVHAPPRRADALLGVQARQVWAVGNFFVTPGVAQGILVSIEGIFGDGGRPRLISLQIGNRGQRLEQNSEPLIAGVCLVRHCLLASNLLRASSSILLCGCHEEARTSYCVF